MGVAHLRIRDPASPPLGERCEIIRVPIDDEARAESVATPASARRQGSALRVAIISPRPAGPAYLPLYPALGPVLATALSTAQAIQLKVIRPPTLAALQSAIANGDRFDVVQFDGHGREGAARTELVFEDANGDPSPSAPTPSPPRSPARRRSWSPDSPSLRVKDEGTLSGDWPLQRRSARSRTVQPE